MNILLLNGAKAYAHSNGRYNDTLHDIARGELAELGHQVRETRIDDGYDLETEVEKWLWADVIIHQMPGWWMGAPWTVKRYLDEVLTTGHGRLYASDGRSRHDPQRHYGSGGLLQGRSYMLSLTWNAPLEAFDEPGNFFEGQGVDGVYFPMHKAHQFLGMSPLPTFLANDVIKAPDIDAHCAAYRDHLRKVFDQA
ncbi:NAD(P)H-dependent oxidoreductase [Halomonas huangheensis]|uniref:NADPH:quinone oxidoreductase MdaB n=1 Tax=Halomonas huangheensis TaxID=1178482 RepID=W1N4S5_9GAMM|nr:NAD(P)H-dependent oxidoreductase [Halomonas huangheensis]ALM51987.1 NADPH quinone reductase MdaB [Halomonas huangheensis]ERL50528.1 NADPH quinone reductase MdaB [Halomonas huangheensis]